MGEDVGHRKRLLRNAKRLLFVSAIATLGIAVYIANNGHVIYITAPIKSLTTVSSGYCAPTGLTPEIVILNCYTLDSEPTLSNYRPWEITRYRIHVRPSETYFGFY